MKWILATSVLVFTCDQPLSHAQAQSNPLLGVWELNLPKSKFQHDATPLGEMRSYKECEGGGVGTHVETTYVNWRVAVTTFCTRLDGKEYPYYSRIAGREDPHQNDLVCGRLTPMLNWHASDNLRLEISCGYGSLDRFGLVGKTQFFQTRFQFLL